MEWALRFYPNTDPTYRPNRISAYIFNLDANTNPAHNLGAGAYAENSDTTGRHNGPEVVEGQWYHVVAVFDPGDELDIEAGVTLYVNGRLSQASDDDSGGPKYVTYSIYPKNGTAPLRFATQEAGSRNSKYFVGGLDEVALFSRKLTTDEIRQLYFAATGILQPDERW